METLFIGFKGKNNSSFQLVSQINGDRLFLTNSFEGLKKDIDSIEKDYDIIYMFGLDKSLKNQIRIDTIAKNNETIVGSDFNIDNFKNILMKNSINYYTSNKPTNYFCNEAYYYVLSKVTKNAVFIHIPSTKNMNENFVEKLVYTFNNL